MEVDIAVIADGANVSQEGKLNILGVFDTIWTPEFPFRHSTMVFVVRMKADFTEQGPHRMDVRLMDADGGQLFRAEGPMQVPGSAPGRPLKPHVIMALNGVSFAKAGDYSFEVIVDGQHMKSVPLYVMSTPPGPSPGHVA